MHVSQNVRIIPLTGDRKADKRAVRRKLKRRRKLERDDAREMKGRYRGY